MTNAPSAPVTASVVRLVPTFLTVTVAPGMTPPPVSVTTPDNLAGQALRASARVAAPATIIANASTALQRRWLTIPSSLSFP